MPHPLPVDTVVFEAGALLGPAAGTPRPGARRLVAALTRAGVTVAVVPAGSTDAGPAGSTDAGPDAGAAGPTDVRSGGPSDVGTGDAGAHDPGATAGTRDAGDGGPDLGREVVAAGFGREVVVGADREVAQRLGLDPERAVLVAAGRHPVAAGPLAGLPVVACGAGAEGGGERAGSAGATGAGVEGGGERAGSAGRAGVDGGGERAGSAGRTGVGEDGGGRPGGRAAHHALHAWLAEAMGALPASQVLWAPLDAEATSAAEARHLQLTKPPGSLGRLEAVGVQLAGIAAQVPPPVPRPAAVAVFAGDHGVHRQGVSPWPQEVTAQMVANFLSGGAAINVLARHAGADVAVVDVGVAADLTALVDPAGPGDGPRLVARKVRAGTGDLSTGPAMTRDEARRALDVGAQVAADLVARGARCLVTGDMGIANTTPASALVAALTGRPAPAVTGHGAGLDADLLAHKAALVEAAAVRARAAHGDDPLGLLAEVGGLEHAALAGYIVGGAALQVPVVVDGVIAAAALLVASRIAPGVERAVIAGHRSVEPGSAAVLGALGLDPMVDLGLRLGEGTGAALALPLVEAAALVLAEMATFDQAGVSDKGA